MRRIAVIGGILALCLFTLAGCSFLAPAPSEDAGAPEPQAQEDPGSAADAEPEDRPAESSQAAPGSFSAQQVVQRDYSALQQRLGDIASAAPVDAGIAFVDVSGETAGSFEVNGDQPLVAASMIKLLILAAFLDGVDQGKYSLDEVYAVQASDIVGGTGSIQYMGAGTTLTYAELAQRMIYESDNVAANVLVNLMGMDAVNEEAQNLGLRETSLNRLMMDADAMARHVENLTSARDTARILELIWRGELVSPVASAFALEALEMQADTAGILSGLPAGTVFAHKTGTLDLVRNDGGIVEGARPYVLVVLCSGADAATAQNLMADVARTVDAVVYEEV